MRRWAVQFEGGPILVEFRPGLRARRGMLFTAGERGVEVHAGSFLRRRTIVLDSALLGSEVERDRILAHEIFHFAWWKLNAKTRRGYEDLIRAEMRAGTPGEMGWSAELRKQRLAERQMETRGRAWRDYLCESFCDTAAAGVCGLSRHREMTLPAAARRRRRAWFDVNILKTAVRI